MMELIPCDKKELGRIWKPTKNFEILQEFAQSDLDCVRAKYDHACAKNAATSLNKSIRIFRMDGIKVVLRKDKVYLIKDY